MRFVTSDWHLRHKNIHKYEPSRGDNFEFEQRIITRTRELVTPADELWFLGDLSFGSSKETEELLGDTFRRCKSYMVEGNHDSSKTKAHFKRLGFKEIFPLWAKVDDMLLTHYPLVTIDVRYPERAAALREVFDREKCRINVHGHTHSKRSPDPRCVNVSVEVTDYRPVDLDTIKLITPQIIPA